MWELKFKKKVYYEKQLSNSFIKQNADLFLKYIIDLFKHLEHPRHLIINKLGKQHYTKSSVVFFNLGFTVDFDVFRWQSREVLIFMSKLDQWFTSSASSPRRWIPRPTSPGSSTTRCSSISPEQMCLSHTPSLYRPAGR